MTFALWTQFHVERPWGQRPYCLNSVLNVKALVYRHFQPGEGPTVIVKYSKPSDSLRFKHYWGRGPDPASPQTQL